MHRIIALSLFLQGIGIAWLAVVYTPHVAYPVLVAPLAVIGIGMGLFFPPIARAALHFAPRGLEGVASGTSNALRQLGTVLGIAALGAVFSATGGYASDTDFVHGLRVAEVVGASLLVLTAVLALAIPTTKKQTTATPDEANAAVAGTMVG
jgi:MFS family permease